MHQGTCAAILYNNSEKKERTRRTSPFTTEFYCATNAWQYAQAMSLSMLGYHMRLGCRGILAELLL